MDKKIIVDLINKKIAVEQEAREKANCDAAIVASLARLSAYYGLLAEVSAADAEEPKAAKAPEILLEEAANPAPAEAAQQAQPQAEEEKKPAKTFAQSELDEFKKSFYHGHAAAPAKADNGETQKTMLFTDAKAKEGYEAAKAAGEEGTPVSIKGVNGHVFVGKAVTPYGHLAKYHHRPRYEFVVWNDACVTMGVEHVNVASGKLSRPFVRVGHYDDIDRIIRIVFGVESECPQMSAYRKILSRAIGKEADRNDAKSAAQD
jgi:hypothetical protein